jgi:arsenite-transporting ATPase
VIRELDELASRQVVLFGGKGGVGKTTISTAAALHFAASRPTILFSTDPQSNLGDLFGTDSVPNLRVESLDAGALYAKFLERHLEQFLEIGDRGTYLDRDELRSFFGLSVPGADELMAWMHIGELAEENPNAMVVVDTAPTGHTLRMLSSGDHFRQLALALDAMQAKHRAMVRQFTRRDVRDAIDVFIDDFETRAQHRRELLTDAARTAFVPVMLSEPLVVEQTRHLIGELQELDVPFVVLNRAHAECRGAEDAAAREAIAPLRVVEAERACFPLDSVERVRDWSVGRASRPLRPGVASERNDGAGRDVLRSRARRAPHIAHAPLLFLAGKGGVGKTTCSASIALQLARRNPDETYVVISVDPAHSLRDLFATIEPPPNLTVETIDTRAKWRRFRDSFGRKIEETFAALTPGNVSLGYDTEALQRLIEMAPPGADELFAITRLYDLSADPAIAGVVVDTAPTGHFLRLLELPEAAGEWIREFMRILLRYREMIPAGSLGEELVRASREMKSLTATLQSERTAVIAVTRPERIVIAETNRLIDSVKSRGIRLGGVIANYVTPETDCACDRSMRAFELEALRGLGEAVVIERRTHPPLTAAELLTLVPL